VACHGVGGVLTSQGMLGHVHDVNTNKCESPYNSQQIDF
jgi:hypothetical protein